MQGKEYASKQYPTRRLGLVRCWYRMVAVRYVGAEEISFNESLSETAVSGALWLSTNMLHSVNIDVRQGKGGYDGSSAACFAPGRIEPWR